MEGESEEEGVIPEVWVENKIVQCTKGKSRAKKCTKGKSRAQTKTEKWHI